MKRRVAMLLMLVSLAGLLVAIPTSAPADGDECGSNAPSLGTQCFFIPEGDVQDTRIDVSYGGNPELCCGYFGPGIGPNGVGYCADVPCTGPGESPQLAGTAMITPTGPDSLVLGTAPVVLSCFWGRLLWGNTILYNTRSHKGGWTGYIGGYCSLPISMITVTQQATNRGNNEGLIFDQHNLDAYAEGGGRCADCRGSWLMKASWIFTLPYDGFWLNPIPPCTLLSPWTLQCQQRESSFR